MWIADEEVNNEFITVKGVKLFCPAFVAGLDYYRVDRVQKRGYKDEKYNEMIYPLQELTADWCTYSKVDVPEPIKEFIMRNGFDRPEANKMPEVIDELLDQMKKKIILNVDELLNYCIELSAKRYAEYLGKQAKKKEKRNRATELADTCKKADNPSAIDDVAFFCIGYRKQSRTMASIRQRMRKLSQRGCLPIFYYKARCRRMCRFG